MDNPVTVGQGQVGKNKHAEYQIKRNKHKKQQPVNSVVNAQMLNCDHALPAHMTAVLL